MLCYALKTRFTTYIIQGSKMFHKNKKKRNKKVSIQESLTYLCILTLKTLYYIIIMSADFFQWPWSAVLSIRQFADFFRWLWSAFSSIRRFADFFQRFWSAVLSIRRFADFFQRFRSAVLSIRRFADFFQWPWSAFWGICWFC